MADAPQDVSQTAGTITDKERQDALEKAYGTGEEGLAESAAANNWIKRINDALVLREKPSVVFNGIPYSRAYLYNQMKGINYAPPRNPKDDREVSLGLVHEKIIAFCAIFLKYKFRRNIKVYDPTGMPIDGLGDVYNLAIEYSQKAEKFLKRLALIYWEVFTQGNAFVLEDWDVRNCTDTDAYTEAGEKGVKVTAKDMDFSYDFIEKLDFRTGKEYQVRRAVSRVLDGRCVIFGNPEIEEVQDQPLVVIEEEISKADAELLYSSLKRWDSVPKERKQVETLTPEKLTLFSATRLANPGDRFIVHRVLDVPNNRFNVLLNGLMLLPRNTPLKLFWPRGNYPLTNVPAERLSGSIYSRSVPAKTKFTADYVDWALKNLALKFEQGVIPAILAKGKYTLSRTMFRAGQVTHGVTPDSYVKADPDNKGVTTQETSFFTLLQGIVEAQTLNPTATGELDPNASATQIAITDQNQRDKLAFLLDGIAAGFMDMALRRCETIESKYTIQQGTTVVDGKTIPVYQNFTINMGGVDHTVTFDDAIGDPSYNHAQKRSDLFKEHYQNKKKGKLAHKYIVNPDDLRSGKYVLDCEIVPERTKEKPLEMQDMWQEFTELLNTFGKNVNIEELKSIYLETRGRPAAIFNTADVMKLQQITAQEGGSMGTPGGTPPAGGGAPAAGGGGAPANVPARPIQNAQARKPTKKMPALMQ